ncbi:MAG: hypothetical protein HY744_29920, partial [Deltaproteobacteria bacterium]|nr:hypothetical protein [Deltaproteobacteria bacterium]
GGQLGTRVLFIRDEGYDPYSSDDLFVSFALGASYLPLVLGPVSVGLTAEYDVGQRTDKARGQKSFLVLHRVAVGAQARFALGNWFAAFVQAAPAAQYAGASLDDGGMDRFLVADDWSWALDTSGGLAARVAKIGDSAEPAAGFWLFAEGGYSFAGELDMTFAPEEDEDDPRQYGSVALPSFSPSGGMMRLGAQVTF